MEPGKRSKNFTEREKMLLIETAKEFVAIIDNKKTDGTSVEAKKQAWMELTTRYNSVSETGPRTEKQLHALYDNLKKKARKNMSDDKSEMYKTGGGTFCPKTTEVDEKIVALLTPQFKPLSNQFDSSAPYYNLDNETEVIIVDQTIANVPGTSKDVAPMAPTLQISLSPKIVEDRRPLSPNVQCPVSEVIAEISEVTPKWNKANLTETKKKNISFISSAIVNRKKQKQTNDDIITAKKLEILEIQRQQELVKMEKNKILLELDIELKKVQLENARMDLEFKRKTYNI